MYWYRSQAITRVSNPCHISTTLMDYDLSSISLVCNNAQENYHATSEKKKIHTHTNQGWPVRELNCFTNGIADQRIESRTWATSHHGRIKSPTVLLWQWRSRGGRAGVGDPAGPHIITMKRRLIWYNVFANQMWNTRAKKKKNYNDTSNRKLRRKEKWKKDLIKSLSPYLGELFGTGETNAQSAYRSTVSRVPPLDGLIGA